MFSGHGEGTGMRGSHLDDSSVFGCADWVQGERKMTANDVWIFQISA